MSVLPVAPDCFRPDQLRINHCLSGLEVHMNITTKTQTPLESAIPCATCHSPTFWRSAYGGPLRCAVCDPWPSLAMVGERWTIVVRRDGSRVWMLCLRRGERAKPIEPPAETDDDGIRSAVLDDDEGSWLVLWKTKHTAAAAAAGGEG